MDHLGSEKTMADLAKGANSQGGVETDVDQIRAPQVAAAQGSLVEHDGVQPLPGEAGRRQVGPGEVGLLEPAPGEHRLGERGVPEARTEQIGVRELPPLDVGAVEMGLDCLRRFLQALPVAERIDFEKV